MERQQDAELRKNLKEKMEQEEGRRHQTMDRIQREDSE